MKRILSLILTLVLCLPLCACGSANTSNEQNKKTVTLTVTNFHDYFDVNTYSGDFSETKSGYHLNSSCTVTISITPRYNIEVNDVTATFDVQENLKYAKWDFADAYYEGGPNVMYRTCYIDIKLPLSGKTEKKMVGIYDALGSSMASMMPIPKLTAVSGSITIVS